MGTEKPFHHDDKVDYGAKNIAELIAVGASDGGRVWEFDGKDPVQSVIEPFSKGVHRAVVNVNGTRRLLTQTDVCRWVATNTAFTKVLDKTLEQLALTKGAVISAPDTDTAIEAFRKAAQNEVSAVAIVDSKNHRLVANLSGSDLRGLDVAHIRAVEKPVTKFLADLHPASLNPIGAPLAFYTIPLTRARSRAQGRLTSVCAVQAPVPEGAPRVGDRRCPRPHCRHLARRCAGQVLHFQCRDAGIGVSTRVPFITACAFVN